MRSGAPPPRTLRIASSACCSPATLQQIAVRAGFDRAHNAARIAKDADDNDLDVRHALARFADEFNAIAIWQRQINQQDVDAWSNKRASAGERIGDACDLQPIGTRHHLRQILAQNRIVLDDSDTREVEMNSIEVLCGATLGQDAPLSQICGSVVVVLWRIVVVLGLVVDPIRCADAETDPDPIQGLEKKPPSPSAAPSANGVSRRGGASPVSENENMSRAARVAPAVALLQAERKPCIATLFLPLKRNVEPHAYSVAVRSVRAVQVIEVAAHLLRFGAAGHQADAQDRGQCQTGGRFHAYPPLRFHRALEGWSALQPHEYGV